MEDGWIEITLDVVDLLRDELKAELFVSEEVVEQGEGGLVVVVVRCVGRSGSVVEPKLLPLVDVVVCNLGVVLAILYVSYPSRYVSTQAPPKEFSSRPYLCGWLSEPSLRCQLCP